MQLLLDTHILLWTFNNDPKLSNKAKEMIDNFGNKIFYSVISMWEVTIKHMKSPNSMRVSGTEFMHYCEQAGFKKLPVDERHVCALETLNKKENSPEHNDPFDRMLLSQAKSDGLLLLTHDKKFSFYDEPYVAIV